MKIPVLVGYNVHVPSFLKKQKEKNSKASLKKTNADRTLIFHSVHTKHSLPLQARIIPTESVPYYQRLSQRNGFKGYLFAAETEAPHNKNLLLTIKFQSGLLIAHFESSQGLNKVFKVYPQPVDQRVLITDPLSSHPRKLCSTLKLETSHCRNCDQTIRRLQCHIQTPERRLPKNEIVRAKTAVTQMSLSL